MTISILLKDYGQYNAWANHNILNWLYAKPLELLEKEVPSSFPSLRLTLLHIWDAEKIWMRRLQGLDATSFPSHNFTGTLIDLKNDLLANSEAFSAFLQDAPDAFFQQQIHYTNTKGQEFTTANAEVIQHCIQHSTYHRGQIVTMARGLGLTDPPSTDFTTYVRNRE